MTNTKLSDMQLVLLTTACQRADGSLLPPPESLGDQAARIRKAVTALIKRGFVAEQEGMDVTRAWRENGDVVIGVIITPAGRAIIEPPVVLETVALVEGVPPVTASIIESGDSIDIPALSATPRPVTKQMLVLDLLKQDGGAALADIVTLTGWLPHTSRAALTGLRKKGHAITSIKIDGTTRYHLAPAA
jgi:hypothetical protein